MDSSLTYLHITLTFIGTTSPPLDLVFQHLACAPTHYNNNATLIIMVCICLTLVEINMLNMQLQQCYLEPRMRVTPGFKWQVGPPRRTCANTPRRRWPPTWLKTADGRGRQVKGALKHAKEGGVDSSDANFIAASGDERGCYFNDGWHVWVYYSPGAQLGEEGDGVLALWLQLEGNSRMRR